MALAVRPPPGHDPLIRMVIVNWIIGAFMGVAIAAVLLAGDVAGLRSLMLGTNFSIPALALLFGGFAITFGGVIAATALMLTNENDEGGDGGHGFGKAFGSGFGAELKPARVRAQGRPQVRTRR